MGYQWGISLWHVDTTRVGGPRRWALGWVIYISTQSQKGSLLSANWLIVREILYRWHPWRWWFIMFFNFYRAVGISAFCPYHYEEILWWFQNIRTKSTWTTETLLACYHCYLPVVYHAAHSDVVIKSNKVKLFCAFYIMIMRSASPEELPLSDAMTHLF